MKLLAAACKTKSREQNEPRLYPVWLARMMKTYTRYVWYVGVDRTIDNERTQIMWAENYQLTILHSHSLLHTFYWHRHNTAAVMGVRR